MQIAECLLACASPTGVEHIPPWVNLEISPQLPFPTAPVDCQVHPFRQRVGSKDEPIEVVPPEFAIPSDITGGDVNGCRHLRRPQTRQSIFQIVEVTVVERDDHSALRQSSTLKGEIQFIERERMRDPPNDFKVLAKMIRTDREKVRIDFRFEYSVIAKNYRGRRNGESQSPPNLTKKAARAARPAAHIEISRHRSHSSRTREPGCDGRTSILEKFR